jgi:hypothetical protein
MIRTDALTLRKSVSVRLARIREGFFDMETAILRAHYDGEHIVLDEPFELIANAPLIVTVVAPDAEHSEWAALGVQALARAYGADEPEYTTADLKPQ